MVLLVLLVVLLAGRGGAGRGGCWCTVRVGGRAAPAAAAAAWAALLASVCLPPASLPAGTSTLGHTPPQGMAEGAYQSAGATLVLFCKLAVGSSALGAAFGLASALWLGYSFDLTTEFMITLTTAYFAYYVADNLLKISGLLAVGGRRARWRGCCWRVRAWLPGCAAAGQETRVRGRRAAASWIGAWGEPSSHAPAAAAAAAGVHAGLGDGADRQEQGVAGRAAWRGDHLEHPRVGPPSLAWPGRACTACAVLLTVLARSCASWPAPLIGTLASPPDQRAPLPLLRRWAANCVLFVYMGVIIALQVMDGSRPGAVSELVSGAAAAALDAPPPAAQGSSLIRGSDWAVVLLMFVILQVGGRGRRQAPLPCRPTSAAEPGWAAAAQPQLKAPPTPSPAPRQREA